MANEQTTVFAENNTKIIGSEVLVEYAENLSRAGKIKLLAGDNPENGFQIVEIPVEGTNQTVRYQVADDRVEMFREKVANGEIKLGRAETNEMTNGDTLPPVVQAEVVKGPIKPEPQNNSQPIVDSEVAEKRKPQQQNEQQHKPAATPETQNQQPSQPISESETQNQQPQGQPTAESEAQSQPTGEKQGGQSNQPLVLPQKRFPRILKTVLKVLAVLSIVAIGAGLVAFSLLKWTGMAALGAFVFIGLPGILVSIFGVIKLSKHFIKSAKLEKTQDQTMTPEPTQNLSEQELLQQELQEEQQRRSEAETRLQIAKLKKERKEIDAQTRAIEEGLENTK